MSAIVDKHGHPTWYFPARSGGEPVFFPVGFTMRGLTEAKIRHYIRDEASKGEEIMRERNEKNARDYYDSLDKRNEEKLFQEKILEEKKKRIADYAADMEKSYLDAGIRRKEAAYQRRKKPLELVDSFNQMALEEPEGIVHETKGKKRGRKVKLKDQNNGDITDNLQSFKRSRSGSRSRSRSSGGSISKSSRYAKKSKTAKKRKNKRKTMRR